MDQAVFIIFLIANPGACGIPLNAQYWYTNSVLTGMEK